MTEKVTGQQKQRIFELKAQKNDPQAVGIVLLKNLIMVGKSLNCDLYINKKVISNVHAVVEIKGDSGTLYDMNSAEGCSVNGKKISGTGSFSLNDTLGFGGIEFKFQEYVEAPDSKYKLDILSPEKSAELFPQQTVINPYLKGKKDLQENKDKDGDFFPFLSGEEEDLPELPDLPPAPKADESPKPIVATYPLAQDEQADFNEYIFEDINEVYPIFNYQVEKQAIEVIILFKDDLISVDYLPLENGKYYLKGYRPKSNEIELPPLGKKVRKEILEVKDSEVEISSLEDYTLLFLQDDKAQILDSEENLSQDQRLKLTDGIARYRNKDVQIFIRRVDAPPRVDRAPAISRDKTYYKKYLLPYGAAALLLLLLFQCTPEQKEEIKKQQVERLAKILYKTKKVRDAQQEGSRKVVQKDATKTPEKKKETKKVKAQKKPSPKKKTRLAKSKGKNRAKKQGKKKVTSFKQFNFKSSLSSLLAKGSQASKAQVKNVDKKVDLPGVSSLAGASSAEKIKRAKVSSKVGSLEGIAAGRLDSSVSAKGLARKGSTLLAEIPTETVVKGSIDPDIIRSILQEHLPQFQFCYQRELEKGTLKQEFEPRAKLDFRIGASGKVIRNNLTIKGYQQGAFKTCLVNVLNGIKFPPPKGGGIVDVVQSINFVTRN